MIGNEIDVPAKDTFYGDGFTLEFTPMSYPYPAGNEIFLLVFIQNVFQNPGVAYNIDNYKITFTSPPPAGHQVVILHGAMNGSAFEPIPAVPVVPSLTTTTTTTTTTTAGPGVSTTTTTTTVAPGSVLNYVLNGDFEIATPLTETVNYIAIPGWKIYKQAASINAVGSVLGCPTPTATIPGYVANDSVLASTAYSGGTVNDFVPGETGSKSLLLLLAGSVSEPNATVHGPVLVSDNYLNLAAGDRVEFHWKVEMKPLSFYVEENFDVYAYLVDLSCRTIMLTHAMGDVRDWTKVSRTITGTEAGEYRFVFVAGSYDRTGGKAIGTQVYLDNVKIIKSGIGL